MIITYYFPLRKPKMRLITMNFLLCFLFVGLLPFATYVYLAIFAGLKRDCFLFLRIWVLTDIFVFGASIIIFFLEVIRPENNL
jgi:hypothetical protein